MSTHLAPDHPVVHLAPELGWMNDPNGLSFVDGVWHAYYQHNPDEDVWGQMHWRHATSPDLVTWTDHGIVMWPGELGTIFSGSVVVDADNTAGFGPGARVAVFTLDDNGDQRQGLAWSPDGFNWTTYDGNPVLVDGDERHFRDPKVFRHDDRWVMVLGVGAEIRFYRSDDLRGWEQVGSHRPDPVPLNAIECPDLIEMRTDAGEPVWVMLYGDDRGGVGGHSGTMVVPGRFDGSTFTQLAEPALLDQGPDFYAAQSFHGRHPARPPVVMAWMNSWPYANLHPSAGRRGVLSLPRVLSVDSLADPLTRSHPAVDLEALFDAGEVVVEARQHGWAGGPVLVTGTGFTLTVNSVHGAAAEVRSDGGLVTLDRPGLGIDGIATRAEVRADEPVSVLIDHGTVEVFTASGQTISALVFPGREWAIDVTGDATAQTLTPRTG